MLDAQFKHKASSIKEQVLKSTKILINRIGIDLTTNRDSGKIVKMISTALEDASQEVRKEAKAGLSALKKSLTPEQVMNILFDSLDSKQLEKVKNVYKNELNYDLDNTTAVPKNQRGSTIRIKSRATSRQNRKKVKKAYVEKSVADISSFGKGKSALINPLPG